MNTVRVIVGPLSGLVGRAFRLAGRFMRLVPIDGRRPLIFHDSELEEEDDGDSGS